MLVNAANIETGIDLPDMELADAALMPRAGEILPINEGVTWEVAQVVWRGYPLALRPVLMLREIVDRDHTLINRGPMDAAEADVFARAAVKEIESR